MPSMAFRAFVRGSGILITLMILQFILMTCAAAIFTTLVRIFLPFLLYIERPFIEIVFA